MYARMPSDAEMAAMGFTRADFEAEDPTEVWPENMPAINLFSGISTQWRVGMNGPTGLDYNVLFARMERLHLSDQDHEWMFDDIRTIEAEALATINRKD